MRGKQGRPTRMSDELLNLVLEHLRANRADLATLREDVREVKLRKGANAQLLVTVYGD